MWGRSDLTLRQNVWYTFEEPSFSRLARVVSMIILTVIILSVIGFLAGSLKGCRWTSQPDGSIDPDAPVELDSPHLARVCLEHVPEQPWGSIELSCIIVFTLEYMIRLLAAGDTDRSHGVAVPSRTEFLLTPLNVIDFVAIAPFYVELIIRSALPGASDSTSLNSLSIMRVLRLTRVLRVFKVSRSFAGIVILMRTLAKSISAIAMLLFFVLLCVVVFAALIYYVEQGTYYESCKCYLREDGSQSPFESILAAGWFCIVTMTTVGYGDIFPVTGPGKAVASLCMVSGLIVISLPITIIGANFDEEYKQVEVEKRTQAVRRLTQRLGDGKPGVTLALIEQLITVQRENVKDQLRQMEVLVEDQVAELDKLIQDLRSQLAEHRVPLETDLSANFAAAHLRAATAASGRFQRSMSRKPSDAQQQGARA